MKRALLAFGFAAALTSPVQGQGCSQCRESIGQTPQRTQSAYRRGIAVLAIAAGTVCAATLVVARRFR